MTRSVGRTHIWFSGRSPGAFPTEPNMSLRNRSGSRGRLLQGSPPLLPLPANIVGDWLLVGEGHGAGHGLADSGVVENPVLDPGLEEQGEAHRLELQVSLGRSEHLVDRSVDANPELPGGRWIDSVVLALILGQNGIRQDP